MAACCARGGGNVRTNKCGGGGSQLKSTFIIISKLAGVIK